MVSAVVTGIGHAFPHTSAQSDLWSGFFRDHYNDNAMARRMFSSVGVEFRHAVVDPLVEDASRWSTAERMDRYASESVPLAQQAVRSALSNAEVVAGDIGLLVVTSCTGYVTPGVDIAIAQDLGLDETAQRLVIGHMGCYAALPGLSTASDYVRLNQKPAVLVSVELPSLHVQAGSNDVEQMVSHALFGDAASAVVVQPDAIGMEVVETASVTDTSCADLMTWTVTDKGFRMTLSSRVPDVLAGHVNSMVDGLLTRNNLGHDDVAGWAAHPGGPRILDVIANELELKPDDLSESHAVLAAHGNCSSPTVLIVLDEIRKRRIVDAGQYVVALAFGPGLTLYATLFRSITA